MRTNFALLPLAAAAALAVAAPLVVPAAAGTAGTAGSAMRRTPVVPRVVEIALSGPELVRSAQVAGDLLSRPRAVAPFSLVAFTWAKGTEPGPLSVRTRSGGHWSTWRQLAPQDDGPDAPASDGTGPDRRAIDRESSIPFWAPASDGVQVRVGTAGAQRPADLRLVMIDPGSSPADDAAVAAILPASAEPALVDELGDSAGTRVPRSSADAAAAEASAVPRIARRADWGADESLRERDLKYTSAIRAAFVHHTAGTNDYRPGEVPRIIRGIYAFHTKIRGWSDIGYNFLVDKYGRVWEGRHGGIELAVQGAHTGGFNAESFGVAAIGDFRKARPSAPMLESIARVIRWKFDGAVTTLDPDSTVFLTSAGGGTSRYEKGKMARFTRISGHRDAGKTSCPGKFLYASLPKVRARVDQLQSAGYAEFGSTAPVIRSVDPPRKLASGAATEPAEPVRPDPAAGAPPISR